MFMTAPISYRECRPSVSQFPVCSRPGAILVEPSMMMDPGDQVARHILLISSTPPFHCILAAGRHFTIEPWTERERSR